MPVAGHVVRHAMTIVALVAPVLSAGVSRGDTPAQPNEAEAPAPHLLSLTNVDAYLEFRGEYTHDRVESEFPGLGARQRSQRNEATEFQERLGLRLDSAFRDPSILTMSSEGVFGLTQSRYYERIGSFDRLDEDNGHLLEWDSRMDFFRGRPVSGSVYSTRQNDRVNRRFLPTLDQERLSYGTQWVWTNDKVPMELSYDYSDTDRTGNFDKRDDEHYSESTLHYGADWLISDAQKLKLSFDHSEDKQSFQGLRRSFETDRDLLRLEHTLGFGDDKQHNLRTLLRWQEERGDLARDIFEFGPQLTLKHSDSLSTVYKYRYLGEEYEDLEVGTHRGDFQLIHQLYSNLTTTVDVFGLHESIDGDVDTGQYGGFVDWQYNRRNRWGQLYANLALGYDTQESSGDDGRRIVLDEAVNFRDPVAPTLRNRNVIGTSIVVTDATNRRVLRRGRDYIVTQWGNVTRLSRIPTGLIADGDTVLVDYQYETPVDGQIDTVRADFSIEQRFSSGLTPYYRLSYRNQEDDPSTGFARWADRTDHHRLGVSYDKKRYSLGAEFEIYDDTVEPYDAFHLIGGLRLLQTSVHQLGATARASRFWFDGGLDDRDVTLFDVQLDHRYQLNRRWSTVERLGYRYEDDSSDGITNGWEVNAGLNYAMGDLSAELTLEYDRLDLPESEQDSYGVFFSIRREFRDVLVRR